MVGDQIFLNAIPAEAGFETSPTVAEVFLGGCPDDLGMEVELMYVGVSFVTVPVDGSDPVTGDLEWVDDSNGDAVTNLVEGFDFEGLTARVMNTIFNGRQILSPGDTLNMELTVTTPDTAGAGAGFLVAGKIKQMMAT